VAAQSELAVFLVCFNGAKNLHSRDRIRTTDPQALTIFPFSFPLNKGELYNTFGGYAEETSAGRLCFHTDTSCSVLLNLRIYGIHGLVIGETEFIGGSGDTGIHFLGVFISFVISSCNKSSKRACGSFIMYYHVILNQPRPCRRLT
jgi:hypothetical protein